MSEEMIKNPIATMEIEGYGNLKFELTLSETPESVKNFVSLCNKGFYDGLTFHRLIKDFVIQGGDPEGTGMGGPGYCIKGEFSSNGFNNPNKHDLGTISWARSMAKNSAGSQFYIALGKVSFLDPDYATFGTLLEGKEILEKLNNLKTGRDDKPNEPVVIKKVEIESFGKHIEEPNKL